MPVEFAEVLSTIAVGALISIGGFLAKKLSVFLNAHTEHVKFNLESEKDWRISTAVDRAIDATNQKFVQNLKAASPNGKLTPEQAKTALEMTKVSVQENLKQMGIALAADMLTDRIEGLLGASKR